MKQVSNDMQAEMLLRMYRIRFFEEAAEQLFHAQFIRGPLHLYIGEEAVATGVCMALTKEDYVFSTHRGHGHTIAKGANLRKMLAELLGREDGYCRGRGGSMHLADPEIGLLGCSGIVGGGIPLSVGAGFSADYRQDNRVAVSFFGDGGANQGSFHESINLAALWKLPVVFVCENNLYALTVPTCTSLPIENISERVASYGIPGKTVDGMDVLAVYEAAREAVDRARAGEGPTLIECKTYRFKGHWVGDPIVYRTQDEVDDWKKKDPIDHLRRIMVDSGIFVEADLDRIKEQPMKEIEDAVKYAKDSPFPDRASVGAYVYS